ncbi:hypothetical protein GCM10010251_49560 [Streptomyces aurantiogriseus]|uniref:Uncharacterized protein n=1 Tax=Streptomyces aurantiogriseus TaxID=66870 RepID=A0A918CLQ2_9ACTN|nr:hypothetical protein GCM10010251_49560 [Streptomyces aurantiogriseus]
MLTAGGPQPGLAPERIGGGVDLDVGDLGLLDKVTLEGEMQDQAVRPVVEGGTQWDMEEIEPQLVTIVGASAIGSPAMVISPMPCPA